jgi:hypothetical protein
VHFSLHEVALSKQGDERLLCAFHIVAHLMLRAAAVRAGCCKAQASSSCTAPATGQFAELSSRKRTDGTNA